MKSLFVAICLLMSVAAFAQQEEVEPVDDDVEPSQEKVLAQIASDVRMHDSPGGTTTATLKAGTDVQIIGMSPGGWVRVRTADGKGWVDRHFVKAPDNGAVLSPKMFALAAQAKKASCFPNLKTCPPSGCMAADDTHGIFNIVKHGPPSGAVKQVTLKTFAGLQTAADKVVGQASELDEEDRESIKKLKVGTATLGERSEVIVSGFIVGKPHPNGGESVNCGLSGVVNNDIHITISDDAENSEFQGIVVEMIPQERPDGWSTTALGKVARTKQRVRITGQLFYDNAHRVNSNPKRNLNGQPKRFSLWEIHPISEFEVCTKEPCDVTKKAGWTKLEDM
ncbi:MAG: Bacterial domain [Acidobacteriota bacterium]|jgi:hypothetical protein|nr:Bacterial domain [Acidobacteriota bacterium]